MSISLWQFSRHPPDSRRSEASIAPLIVSGNGKSQLRGQEAIQLRRLAARGAETWRFARIKAYLTHGSLAVSDLSARHAGAGGARILAISDRMSGNICRGTTAPRPRPSGT